MLIADTSALISLFIDSDINHSRAYNIVDVYTRKVDNFLIPECILAELINTIGKKFGHRTAYNAAQTIMNTNHFLIEESTEKVRLNALEKFNIQPESVSFTDCMVMAVADQFETKEIFGFDEVFRKNGYIRLGIDKVK